jgi:hypothetical protein
MGKVRQIFVWDGVRDLGPFRREELIEQINAGAVLPGHFFFEEGMTDWARVATLPGCARLLASDAQKAMLTRMGVEYDEYITKDDVSRILEEQPATERQLALIAYLGLAARPHLTKNEAGDLIEVAKQDPRLGSRFESWNAERLELHPDIYSTERKALKDSRAEILLEEYENFRSDLIENGMDAPKLLLDDVARLIVELDGSVEGWDRDIRLTGLDHLLELVRPQS